MRTRAGPSSSSGPAGRAAARRRRVLLRVIAPRRPRARRRQDRLRSTPRRPRRRDGPLADYRVKGVEDDRLSGGSPASPGPGGGARSLRWPGVGAASPQGRGRRGPGPRRPTRSGPDGRRARPPAALPRPQPVHRAPPHLKILALLGSCWSWWRPPRSGSRPSASTPARPAGGHRGQPGAAALPVEADGRRGAVRGLRGADAVHRPRAAHRGARAHRQRARPDGRPGRCSSRARSACWPSLTLAATTEPTTCSRASSGCGCRDLIVQIMGFMIRYLDVVTAEMRRMMVAMRSRGCDPRSPRHWPVLARALGALFIRSYERGERVHLAMLSRGYTGCPRQGARGR